MRRESPAISWIHSPACTASTPRLSISIPSAAPWGSSPARSRAGRSAAHLAYDGQPGRLVQRIVAWLEDHIEPERAASLVHNDFKLDNVILDAEHFTPVAVVDWDMCTRGCPLYDLAVLLSYWTEPDDHPVMHALRQMPSAAPGFPSRTEIIDAYAQASGIDIGDFRFYRALSVFRLAIIMRQLFNLYRRKVRTSPEFARFGGVAEGLLDLNLAIIDGRRD